MTAQLPEPDLNYMQRVLLEMLAIPSPTGFTDTIVRYVAERLTELGIPFELTRRGTIRATLKGRRYSPDRAVAAHLDTIGAIVREIHDTGRLGLAPVGCWSSRFAEGSRVSVFTDTGVIRGSVLPLLASGHANTAVDEAPVSWDHVELRLDAYTYSRNETCALGSTLVISSPSIPCPSSPRAATSVLATWTTRRRRGPAGRAQGHRGKRPRAADRRTRCSPSPRKPAPVPPRPALGCQRVRRHRHRPAAKGQASSEHAVTVAMQDSGGPYDFHLSRHLLKLATEHEIPVRRDLFRYYHSDAQSAVEAGHDIRTALLAFGCDATHGYERTHIDSLAAMSRLLCGYMLSQPVFASDAQHAKDSLERFSHQLEHDAQMENDTRVPPVDTLIGRHSNPQERNS